MAETLTVDTTPQTEVLTEDEQESLEIGEQMETAQDNLLAGKYKDAQQLEQAYIELQKKLGSTEDSSEPQTEMSEEIEEEPETEKEEVDTSFLDRLWDESQSEYQDNTMQELSEMSPRDLAQMHLQYRADNQQPPQETLNDSQVTQLKDIAGGEKSYNNMLGWAKDNLADGEINMYDAVMEKGDPMACFFAVQALKYRFDDASGVDGQMLTGKAPSSGGDTYQSQAQVVEAMSDPKYDNDPAYRREVMKKLERSDIQF